MLIKSLTFAAALLQNTNNGTPHLIRFKQIPSGLTEEQRDEFWTAFKEDANKFNDVNGKVHIRSHSIDIDVDQLTDPL